MYVKILKEGGASKISDISISKIDKWMGWIEKYTRDFAHAKSSVKMLSLHSALENEECQTMWVFAC